MDVNAILKAISEGFRKTPKEALYSAVGIAAMILTAVLVSGIYGLVQRSKQVKKWTVEYDRLVRSLNLTVNELDLIDQMALLLRDPLRKVLILQNRNTFERALSLISEMDKAPVPYSRELREKLFDAEKIKTSPGQGRPARLITEQGHVFTGYLAEMHGEEFLLENTRKHETTRKAGNPRLLVQDFNGIDFYPVTSVKKEEGNTLRIKTDRGTASFIKKQVLQEVFLYLPHEKEPYSVQMVLFPRKRALIDNVDRCLNKGDIVRLSIKTDTDKIYRINAVVENLSLNRAYAHIYFGFLRK